MEFRNILAESENYILGNDFEDCILAHKQTNTSLVVGDHYGDPECGLIAPDETWCMTGGEGVILWDFNGKVWIGFRTGDSQKTDNLHFANPNDAAWLKSLDNSACQFVHDMKIETPTLVRLLLNPWATYASTWQLDVTSKTLTKMRNGPSLQDQPWTEEKIDF